MEDKEKREREDGRWKEREREDGKWKERERMEDRKKDRERMDAPSYATEILFRQVYFWEVLDHLHSIEKGTYRER